MKVIIAAAFLLAASPALATGSIAGFEKGGRFVRFDPVVSQYNMSGETFRIDGTCKSACTLFLAIHNVCVTRSATFYFHAGHDPQRRITASATSHMIGAYNEGLRNYVLANHYMDTLEFHAISGRDMITKFGYRECPRQSRR
jgi:hypothetical protein